MSVEPLVSIGLVSWNSAAHLPACLSALAGQTYPRREVIVVDNASTDDSLTRVAAHLPSARIITNTYNTGFCRAHNLAIRAAQGAYYLPLNPDACLHPDYLARLVAALEAAPDFGSAGGKLSRPPLEGEAAQIDSTGLFLDRRRRQYLRGHGETDTGQYAAADEVFGMDGAAPLYRRAMLDDIAMDGEYFDESFFAHKEDVDLAWRARLLGWKCAYVPNATAYHARGFRPGRRAPLSTEVRLHAVKNRYLLLLKNESAAGWKRDGAHIVWYDLQILAYLLVFERSSLAALPLLRRVWPRARLWRERLWPRVRVDPETMLKWFR
jgi:GT2 family glycosyltransferase